MTVVVQPGEPVPDGQAFHFLEKQGVFEGRFSLQGEDAKQFGFFRGEGLIPAGRHQSQPITGLEPLLQDHRAGGLAGRTIATAVHVPAQPALKPPVEARPGLGGQAVPEPGRRGGFFLSQALESDA